MWIGNGNEQVANLLITSGADVNAKNNENKSIPNLKEEFLKRPPQPTEILEGDEENYFDFSKEIREDEGEDEGEGEEEGEEKGEETEEKDDSENLYVESKHGKKRKGAGMNEEEDTSKDNSGKNEEEEQKQIIQKTLDSIPKGSSRAEIFDALEKAEEEYESQSKHKKKKMQ